MGLAIDTNDVWMARNSGPLGNLNWLLRVVEFRSVQTSLSLASLAAAASVSQRQCDTASAAAYVLTTK